MTHRSVKCIYATPHKQDNVDSELEVTETSGVMRMAMFGLPD